MHLDVKKSQNRDAAQADCVSKIDAGYRKAQKLYQLPPIMFILSFNTELFNGKASLDMDTYLSRLTDLGINKILVDLKSMCR